MTNPHNKGKRGEYAVRDMLKGFGYDARRTPMSGAIEGWKGDITSNFPFWLEVKNTETSKFLEWYKKASDQCGALPPMIAWTKNYEEIYAFCKLSDLLVILGGGTILALPKKTKPKRLSIEETADLPFSKAKQLRR